MLLNILFTSIGVIIGATICKIVDKHLDKKKQEDKLLTKELMNRPETASDRMLGLLLSLPNQVEKENDNIPNYTENSENTIKNKAENSQEKPVLSDNETKISKIKNDNEELISALKIIKATCEMAYDCPECTLRMGEDDCNFVCRPKDWDVDEEFDGNDKAIK